MWFISWNVIFVPNLGFKMSDFFLFCPHFYILSNKFQVCLQTINCKLVIMVYMTFLLGLVHKTSLLSLFDYKFVICLSVCVNVCLLKFLLHHIWAWRRNKARERRRLEWPPLHHYPLELNIDKSGHRQKIR